MSKISDISPEALLSLIAEGNSEAESLLVNKYWRGLYFILLKDCKDPTLTEDICQDTFIAVLKKARTGQIENPDAIASFIRQTGINLIINYRRKEKRRATEAIENIDSTYSDNTTCLQIALEEHELSTIVKQVINENVENPRYRELLRLFYIYGKDKKFICNKLELSPDNFDTLINRARNSLIAKIKERLSNRRKIHPNSLSLVLFYIFITQQINGLNVSFDNDECSVRETPSMAHLTNCTTQASSNRYALTATFVAEEVVN